MKAVVEYDGAAYAGFQRQPALPTIQGALEKALTVIAGEPPRVTYAGRTDAGAHAAGQVISFELDTRLDDGTLLRAVNANLPGDVALQALSTVEPAFDPRRQATSREYKYLVLNRPAPSPLWRGRAFHVPQPLDLGLMREGAGHLTGTHDFSSFGTPSRDAPPDPAFPRTAVRTIFSVDIRPQGQVVDFRFVGTGFMQHMVRTMVGTLLLVGGRAIAPEEIAAIRDARDRARAAPPAPAWALYLMRVDYEPGRA